MRKELSFKTDMQRNGKIYIYILSIVFSGYLAGHTSDYTN